MLVIRSIAFNVLFYLNLGVLMVAAIPTFVMPRRAILDMAKLWARSSLWLLRVVCKLRYEIRGLEKIPPGPLIVAAKHQSAWETFALLTLFDDPTFIIKRELMWIPLFGWFTVKGRMVPVRRGARAQALAEMAARAKIELDRGRQLIIFPEGTRRPPGAEPRYKYGVAHLYGETGAPCLPVALNSGLFWARRSLIRRPGTVLVEILDPIPPGLEPQAFFERLQSAIEAATARLIAEGERDSGRRLPRAASERAV
ncbi:MAG TPA: lysophospholipid acyltransferase family protein [Xanthobacteraceae bacterium]|nr:lysophospholipid acyltransferase family protein [Xanthobacteraceae bacterium]